MTEEDRRMSHDRCMSDSQGSVPISHCCFRTAKYEVWQMIAEQVRILLAIEDGKNT
jgi:hypothetical protein